jgi:hypothetical protein
MYYVACFGWGTESDIDVLLVEAINRERGELNHEDITLCHRFTFHSEQ